MAELLSQARKVMPTVANRVIFENELGRHRSAQAEGKRRGPIELIVRESTDRICCFFTVLE